MSLGFLLTDDSPVIWRGPLVMRALQQLMSDVEWGELDVILFDMPPGTGDAQLTLSQSIALDGAIGAYSAISFARISMMVFCWYLFFVA